MEQNESGKKLKRGIMSFLTQKPIWAFWIAYSALSGILFGIFYATMYIMAQRWWIPVITILAVGIIWGSIRFTSDAHAEKAENKKDETS